MKIVVKLMALAAVVALAACEHTAPAQQPPEAVDPQPPSAQNQNQAAQSQGANQQQTVITLHLAQEQEEEELVAVDAGGESPLYALPQPVIIQSDMNRVTPVRQEGEASYLLIEMNEQGIPKLHTITEQARGHYLLLSVQGQLVSVAQITEPIKDGRLLVGTEGPEHTQAILQLMQGRGAAN